MLRKVTTVGTLVVVTLLHLIGAAQGPVHAQPTFVIADRKPVARGPLFVTIGKFGATGSPGIAVASFWIDEVTVYLAADGGGLGAPPIRLAVGRNLRDLAAVDLDGDGRDDLVVSDEAGGSRDARLFSFANSGGAFQAPDELPLETSVIRTLRTGNFDGVAPDDFASANGRLETASIVFARSTELSPIGNIFLGEVVNDVAAIDIDGDGLDDLAVLTDHGDGRSAITALHSAAIGFAVVPPAIELDVGGVRMARGDYDGDGVLDLAVVAGGPSETEYSVRVLRTRRPAPPPGEPLFGVESRSFPCPPDNRGDPSRCTLSDAVSGDFDLNQAYELAISMPDPGVVAILPRDLFGAFGTPQYLGFAGSPRGLAVGDVSGDAVADLVVTEFDEDAVSVAVSVVPPRRDVGERCDAGIECETGACVDTACCLELGCSLSERCDITGHRGSCSRPLGAGAACDKAADCRSAMCSAQAPASGVCLPGSAAEMCGGDCNDDAAITVDEIVLIIQIALGVREPGLCPSADRSSDGQITVDEIIAAVDLALDGCPLPAAG